MPRQQPPMESKVRTGNYALVFIDGKGPVGLCQSVRGQVGFTVQPQYEIGSINPVENVPTRAVYTVTVRKAVILSNDPYLAVIPVNGEQALEGLVFDIEIYDKRTTGPAALLRKFEACTYDSGTVSVDANQVTFKDATFRALNVSGGGL